MRLLEKITLVKVPFNYSKPFQSYDFRSMSEAPTQLLGTRIGEWLERQQISFSPSTQTVGGSQRTVGGWRDPPALQAERHPPDCGAPSHHAFVAERALCWHAHPAARIAEPLPVTADLCSMLSSMFASKPPDFSGEWLCTCAPYPMPQPKKPQHEAAQVRRWALLAATSRVTRAS